MSNSDAERQGLIIVHQGGQVRKSEGLVLEEPDIEERRFGPGLETLRIPP